MTFESDELTPDVSIRHFYGGQLRLHRSRAGLGLGKLARLVPSSRSTLCRIELARAMPDRALSEAFDRLFGTGDYFVTLYALVRRDQFPDQYKRRMKLEVEATAIEEFANDVVPGLVQTADYARAVFRVSKPRASEEVIEDLVNGRPDRQEILRRNSPPYLGVILDEAVLRRPVGGLAIMHDQLERLLPLVHTPSTVVQVLPFGHGEHALLGGSMTILTFQNGSSAVYEEAITATMMLEDSESIAPRRQAYDLLRAYALSPRESAALILQVMKDYETHAHP